jgi:hypothetical protein
VVTEQYADAVLGGGVSHHHPFGAFFTGLSYQSLNRQAVWQPTAAYTFFPGDNPLLYLRLKGDLLLRDEKPTGGVGHGTVGGRLNPNNWLELTGGFGEIRYYQEGLGRLVYNIADLTTARLLLRVSHRLKEGRWLSLIFSSEWKERAESGVSYHHQGLSLFFSFYPTPKQL